MDCLESLVKVYKDNLLSFKELGSIDDFVSKDLIKELMVQDVNIGVDTLVGMLDKSDVMKSMLTLLQNDVVDTTSSVAGTIFSSSLANTDSKHPLAGKLDIRPTALNTVNLDESTDGVPNLKALTDLLKDEGRTAALVERVKESFDNRLKSDNILKNKDNHLGVSILVGSDGKISTNAAAAIVVSIYNFLNTAGSEFTEGSRIKDKEDLAKFIGDIENIPNVDDLITELNSSGMYLKSNTVVATDLGASVMATLGIKAKEKALTEAEEAKLKSTLGVITIMMGEALNVFKTATYSDTVGTTNRVKGFSADSHVNKNRTAVRAFTSKEKEKLDKEEKKEQKGNPKLVITVQATDNLKLGEETNLTKLRSYVKSYIESKIRGTPDPVKGTEMNISTIKLAAKVGEGKFKSVKAIYVADEKGNVKVTNIILTEKGKDDIVIAGKGKVRQVENVDVLSDDYSSSESAPSSDEEYNWDDSSYDSIAYDMETVDWSSPPVDAYESDMSSGVTLQEGTLKPKAELYRVSYTNASKEEESSGVSIPVVRDLKDTLKSVLEVEPTFTSTVSNAPVSNKHELRRAEFSTPNAKVIETLDALGKMPFKLSHLGDWIYDQVQEKGLPETVVMLVKAYGYVDEFSPGFLSSSFNEKESIKGKNSAIRETVESMVQLVMNTSNSSERNDIYFNWFAAKNERKHIEVRNDGVKGSADPQADKLGSRWLMTPVRENSEHNSIETSLVTDLESLAKEGKLLDKLDSDSFRDKYFDALELMYGVVQGFDDFSGVVGSKIPAIDKNSTPLDVVNAFTELRNLAATLDNNGVSNLDKTVLSYLNSIDNTDKKRSTKGHFGHAIVSIKTLLAVNTALENKDKVFSHEQLVEWDGKTNGVAFKFMQKPLGHNYMQHMYAMGIRPASDKHHNTQTLGVVAEKNPGGLRELDPYQFLGSTFGENLTSISSNIEDVLERNIAKAKQSIEAETDKIRKDQTPNEEKIKNQERVVREAEMAIKGVQLLKRNKLFIDVSNRLSSELRNIAKDPTMFFGYGAGLNKLGEEIVNAQLDDLINTIVREGNTDVLKDLVKTSTGKDLTSKEVTSLLEDLRNKSLNSVRVNVDPKSPADTGVSFKDIIEPIRLGMKVTYGTSVKAALNQHFGSYIELNNLESSTMNAAFDLLDALYQVKVNTAIKYKFLQDNVTTDISKEEKVDIIKSLMPLIPALDTHDSVNEYDNLKLIDGSLGDEIRSRGKDNTVNLHQLEGKGKNDSISVFAPLFGLEGPNAKTPVMGTHVQDASTLSKTFLDAVESNNPFTMMHDALIKVVGGNLSKAYNKNFYENNRYYSQSEALKNYLQKFQQKFTAEFSFAIRDFQNLGDLSSGTGMPNMSVKVPWVFVGYKNSTGSTVLIDEKGVVSGDTILMHDFSNIPAREAKKQDSKKGKDKKQVGDPTSTVVSLADQIDLQRQYAEEIQRNSDDLHRNSLKIMQMGGIPGSAYNTAETAITTEKDVLDVYKALLDSKDKNVMALLEEAKNHKGWVNCG